MERGVPFVLASASPRRRELIGIFRFPSLRIIPSPWEEEVCCDTPQETVMAIASGKCMAVVPMCTPREAVLAADTLVFLDGQRLGKPRDRAQAREMLRALSGRTHTVCTGCALHWNGRTERFAETSLVTFRKLGEDEIEAYLDTGEPMDKAGAYGIQGRGALFITGITGDYYNVMGLPVCLVGQKLRQMGIPF